MLCHTLRTSSEVTRHLLSSSLMIRPPAEKIMLQVRATPGVVIPQ
jgi:hypothetical protein